MVSQREREWSRQAGSHQATPGPVDRGLAIKSEIGWRPKKKWNPWCSLCQSCQRSARASLQQQGWRQQGFRLDGEQADLSQGRCPVACPHCPNLHPFHHLPHCGSQSDPGVPPRVLGCCRFWSAKGQHTHLLCKERREHVPGHATACGCCQV